MWNLFNTLMIIFELGLLTWFVIGKIRKNRLSETILFIGFVFTLNLILHIHALSYKLTADADLSGSFVDYISCIGSSVKMFVGEVDTDTIGKIASDSTLFTHTYSFGMGLALLSTINTVIEALDHTVRNNYRLSKKMGSECCDIVVGNSPTSLKYARSSGAVILLDAEVSKETVHNLIEEGFAVLHKTFTTKLLASRIFRKTTRYNIVCPSEENTLEYINTTLSFIESNPNRLEIHLFVEIEGDKAETIRRKFIDNDLRRIIDQQRHVYINEKRDDIIFEFCTMLSNEVTGSVVGTVISRTISNELRDISIEVLGKLINEKIDNILSDKNSKISSENIFDFDEQTLLSIIEDISKKIKDEAICAGLKETIKKLSVIKLCEIIDKNLKISSIDLFSINQLLARTFTEENPVSKYIPKEFIKDGALISEADIAVFIIGYGKFGSELLKNSVLNNQYVNYSDGYNVHPLHYYLCDTAIDSSEWLISGMKKSIDELIPSADKYFPLPEMPYIADVISASPSSHQVIKAVKDHAAKPYSYAFIIVDTDDDYSNIEIAAKLESNLYGNDNFRIFVRSEDSSVKSDGVISYFGKSESVLTHDIIVNDCFSVMGKKLNEIYEAYYASKDEKERNDFADYIRKKANVSWAGLDYFTKYSNIYGAMNLRVKLNLLGLDYYSGDEAPTGTELLPCYRDGQSYPEYLIYSERNALIAQEHARWNAYHLINEWMPLEKDGIIENRKPDNSVKFTAKIPAAKKHACLTTHTGLNELSEYLVHTANNGSTLAEYGYYRNDELLLAGIDDIFNTFSYSAYYR